MIDVCARWHQPNSAASQLTPSHPHPIIPPTRPHCLMPVPVLAAGQMRCAAILNCSRTAAAAPPSAHRQWPCFIGSSDAIPAAHQTTASASDTPQISVSKRHRARDCRPPSPARRPPSAAAGASGGVHRTCLEALALHPSERRSNDSRLRSSPAASPRPPASRRAPVCYTRKPCAAAHARPNQTRIMPGRTASPMESPIHSLTQFHVWRRETLLSTAGAQQ